MKWKKAAPMLAVSALLLAGCSAGSSDGGDSSKNLTIVSWGATFQEAQEASSITPWAAETGTKVTVDSPPDISKLKVMVESGNPTWDVYIANPMEVIAYCGTLFEKIDYTNIDKSEFPESELSDCGVPFQTIGYMVFYNTNTYADNPPTSITDFFDTTNFPGTRSFSNFPGEGNYELALVAAGVDQADLYPIDYDKALAQYDKIRSGAVFWESGAEQIELMTQERADMILAWNGRAESAIAEGAPYAPVWDGYALASGLLSIVKDSKNLDAAQSYVEYATGADSQLEWALASGYGAGNLKVSDLLPAERQKWDVMNPEHLKTAVPLDQLWWSKNLDEATTRWTEWSVG